MENRPAKKMRIRGRWALAGIIVLLMAISQVAGALASSTYKVQPGDTLSGIASRYGVTVDAIVAANGLATRSTIYSGQMLTIPSPGSNPNPVPPQGVPSNSGTYTVQPGDNLITLAGKFGVTREALAAANGISPSGFLYVGQVLKIPGAGTTPPSVPVAMATTLPAAPTVTTVVAQSTTTPIPVSAPPITDTGKPIQYTVQAGDNLSSIAAKFKTTTDALISLNNLNDGNFVTVGQVLTIVKGNDQSNNPPASAVPPEPAPPMGQFGPKWVDVNLTTQMMYAYEGQTPVFSSKVSSGVWDHPTVEGTYRVYAKYKSTAMKGGTGAEYYNIPNVPYTMYFYSGYALHGAYWHNNFGHPMSHGCVNLPVDASKWMYEWAPIGTMVVTHK